MVAKEKKIAHSTYRTVCDSTCILSGFGKLWRYSVRYRLLYVTMQNPAINISFNGRQMASLKAFLCFIISSAFKPASEVDHQQFYKSLQITDGPTEMFGFRGRYSL